MIRNTAWLAWSGAINIANGIVLWVALGHWRESNEMGQFSAVMSIYTIFVTICTLGLNPYLINEIARRKDRREFVAGSIILITIWSGFCSFLMILTGYVTDLPARGLTGTIILGAAIIPSGIIGIAESVFIALGKTRSIAIATTAENLLRTAIPLLLLFRGYSLPAIWISFVVFRLATCAAYTIAARRHIHLNLLPSRRLIRETLMKTPIFAGVTILAAIHWQIGTILVSRLGGDVMAANFAVASRLLVPVTLLLWSYASVIQPAAARAAATPAMLTRLLSRSLLPVIPPGLLLCVVTILFGKDLLALLFSPGYAEASASLDILSLSIIPFGIVMIASRGLIAMGRQHIDLIGNAAAVAVNLTANFCMIPRYGAAGAATAQLISMTVLAGIDAGVILMLLNRNKIRRPSRNAPDRKTRSRVLMVGTHPTKTIGGISALICNILRSPLAKDFEFRHIASHRDGYGKTGKFIIAVISLLKFIVLLLLWHPKLVYVHVGGNASLYRKSTFITLARCLGRRVLTHFHAGDFDFYFDRQPRLGREIIRRSLGLSHRLIAVSGHTATGLIRLLPDSNISVIPNGIDVSIFDEDGESRTANDDLIRLLFVGAMGRLKGEMDLLCALRQFAGDNRKLRVTMLGNGSEILRPHSLTSAIWPIIEYMGAVPFEARVKFFNRADIFVLPTYAEGMPVAVIEAMAAGLPVIATRVGGIPELIEDGVEGYLIAPGDVGALADRIDRLLDNPHERQMMGQRGRARSRNFDEKQFFERLSEQFRLSADPHQTVVGIK